MSYGFAPLLGELNRITAGGSEASIKDTLLSDALQGESSSELDPGISPDLAAGMSRHEEIALATGKLLFKAETYNEVAGMSHPENTFAKDNGAVMLGTLALSGEVSDPWERDITVLSTLLVLYSDKTALDFSEFDESALEESGVEGFREEIVNFLTTISYNQKLIDGIATRHYRWNGVTTDDWLTDEQMIDLSRGLAATIE